MIFSNSSDNCSYKDKPTDIDESCSLNSIRQTFLHIISLIKDMNDPKFSVDAEITTKNGIIKTVTFSMQSLQNIMLTESSIYISDIAFSLCDVVKITVLTSTLLDPMFATKLLNSINSITTTPNYENNDCYTSCQSKDVSCAQDMQDFINKNMGSIENVSYNGSFAKIKDIDTVGDISKVTVLETSTIQQKDVSVLKDATLNTQTTPVLNKASISSETTPVLDNAKLDTQTTPVVKTVKPSVNQVVSDVLLDNDTVISYVTPTYTDVCAPLKVTPTTVVNKGTTKQKDYVESIKVDKDIAVKQTKTTTAPAITSFKTTSTVKGVISGVTNPASITPEISLIPKFDCDGSGLLTVTIPAKSISGVLPTQDILLNVQVNDKSISYIGSDKRYVLSDATKLIGYKNGMPVSSDITQFSDPVKEDFVNSVTTSTIPVVTSVVANSLTDTFVTSVSTTDINNPAEPKIKTVVEDVKDESININSVNKVNKIATSNLFTTTTQDVVSSVDLITSEKNVVSSSMINTEKTNALSSANLTTNEQDVVENASLTQTFFSVVNDLIEKKVPVLSPANENIDGKISSAGDGIMTVTNTNGDISIYSICDINTLSE